MKCSELILCKTGYEYVYCKGILLLRSSRAKRCLLLLILGCEYKVLEKLWIFALSEIFLWERLRWRIRRVGIINTLWAKLLFFLEVIIVGYIHFYHVFIIIIMSDVLHFVTSSPVRSFPKRRDVNICVFGYNDTEFFVFYRIKVFDLNKVYIYGMYQLLLPKKINKI
jgi:hypothetical protein